MTNKKFVSSFTADEGQFKVIMVPDVNFLSTPFCQENIQFGIIDEYNMALIEKSRYWDELSWEWNVSKSPPAFIVSKRRVGSPELHSVFNMELLFICIMVSVQRILANPFKFIIYDFYIANSIIEITRNLSMFGRAGYLNTRNIKLKQSNLRKIKILFNASEMIFKNELKMQKYLEMREFILDICNPEIQDLLPQKILIISFLETHFREFLHRKIDQENLQKFRISRNNIVHGNKMAALEHRIIYELFIKSLLDFIME